MRLVFLPCYIRGVNKITTLQLLLALLGDLRER